MTVAGNNLATIIVQTVCAARDRKDSNFGPLTGLLCEDAVQKLGWQSNPGAVIELMLRSMGCSFPSDGSKLFRRASPNYALKLQPTASWHTRRPAPTRETTLGALSNLTLEHDAEQHVRGGQAAQRAAEAARPPLPMTLARVAAAPLDRFTTRLGTGWGHMPMPRSPRCVAEVSSIESLVLAVQEHAARCGPLTALVDGGGAAHWSAHSVGVVGVFRFTCAAGCCLNWSSAKRLQRRPQRCVREPHRHVASVCARRSRTRATRVRARRQVWRPASHAHITDAPCTRRGSPLASTGPEMSRGSRSLRFATTARSHSERRSTAMLAPIVATIAVSRAW